MPVNDTAPIALLRPLASPATLRAAIADQLRVAIVSGDLAPGTLLREVVLAERLGVSPTPVREALAQLASEGLVEIEPNRLRRVTPLDLGAITDLIEVQTALWRLAYIRAFPLLIASDVERLRDAVATIAAGVEKGDAFTVQVGMDIFNSTLLDRAGSPEIKRLTLDRRALLTRHLVLFADLVLNGDWVEGHQGMLAAIDGGSLSEMLSHSDAMTARLIAQTAARASEA